MKKIYKRPVTTFNMPYVIKTCVCQGTPTQDEWANSKKRDNDIDKNDEITFNQDSWGNIW